MINDFHIETEWIPIYLPNIKYIAYYSLIALKPIKKEILSLRFSGNTENLATSKRTQQRRKILSRSVMFKN